MRRIWTQCYKELVQFQRDRFSLALIFLLPLMTLLIYGLAVRLQAKDIPLVVQDLDNSYLSRTYTAQLFATNFFQPISWSSSKPVSDALELDMARVAIVIPPDFSRNIKSLKPSTVQVLVDGTDVNNARIVKSTIKATTNFFLQSLGLQPTNNLTTEVVIWFNPGQKESLFFVPGVYGFVLWVYPSVVAAISIVQEKELGTIIPIYASSLSATEFLLGKTLAYLLVGLSEALFIMILGALIFQLSFAGNPIFLLIGTIIFISTSVLFGLFVGVYAKNQIAAIQNTGITGFLASLLLSGYIYPLKNVPFPLSLLSYIVPTRYYIELSRDVFVRGARGAEVEFGLVIVASIGFLLFKVSHQKLRRMQLPD